MKDHSINQDLATEVARLGASKMDTCMQCGNCSAACSLSTQDTAFPRKIYRYLQLGLKDKLLEAPEPWLCYYCGDCNTDCPRDAEPAETMMATRRWLTTQYDWTGLSRRFYHSEKWEFAALGLVSLFVILLFVFFHGPIITERMSVNTFAPVIWVEIGDLTMAVILAGLLLSNGFRMYILIMQGTQIPLGLYFSEAKSFLIHFLTQKRWSSCGENKRRWLVHLVLVSGYLTMLTLVIVFLHWLQVDDNSWHISSLFGYYATGTLLYATIEMYRSRRRKLSTMHRFSHGSDWLFLILLFLTTATGILMHLFRLANWPLGTYIIYVIHLAIAVPMLVIEVPFGKWSHLFYRPFAIFLTTIKAKATQASQVKRSTIEEDVGEQFKTCMQCGTCTGTCPVSSITPYSPRAILRNISLNRSNASTVDEAAWNCVTCNHCVDQCPRDIGIIDLITSIRRQVVEKKALPEYLKPVARSLKREGNPWDGKRAERMAWLGENTLPLPSTGTAPTETERYCLFTCCTTAYSSSYSSNYSSNSASHPAEAGRALISLLEKGGITCTSLGSKENCCGDIAEKMGEAALAKQLKEANQDLFRQEHIHHLLTVSPHCFNTFKKNYPACADLEISHYSQLLDAMIQNRKLLPAGSFPCTVTYHDPCYLGRHNGIYDEPRRILQAIPDLKLVEMQHCRDQSFCCGGGGGGSFLPKKKETSLALIRVKEAMNTGARIIATACPYCSIMLGEAIEQLGVSNSIEVKDIAELLLLSLENKAISQYGTRIPTSSQEACHV